MGDTAVLSEVTHLLTKGNCEAPQVCVWNTADLSEVIHLLAKG